MTWLNPIVAVTDRLGYLYCIDCVLDSDQVEAELDSGNGAVKGESCDRCGRRELFDSGRREQAPIR